MTTLVTGFEPFGGSKTNTSELVVRGVAGRVPPRVVTALLPTSYRRAEGQIVDLIRSHQPHAVLLLGMNARVTRVALEQVALNLDDSAAPDNDGEVRLRRTIADDAPVGYRSSLRLDAMADVAVAQGEGVAFSHDAGGYVCNHVFYIAAHLVARQLHGTGCGLVHLPAVEAPSEKLLRLVRLVETWVSGWE